MSITHATNVSKSSIATPHAKSSTDTNIRNNVREYVRRADERAAELHYEKLFEQPPQLHRDCPICFIRLPLLYTGRRYYECCGKEICTGCWYAPVYDNQGTKIDEMKCPFCRTPIPKSHEEAIERYNIRMEVGDAQAIYNLGIYYRDGRQGLQQDYTKTLELLHRSAELGYAEAYNSIGCAYDIGEGAKVDKKKAMYYYELAAMEGDVNARHNLGNDELNAGNYDRALKHYMIAINGGFNGSVDQIKEMYLHGDATRDDYTKALRIYQTYLGEIKSDQRDKAAAVHEEYHYY